MGSLLLINLYCTHNGMKQAGSWPFFEQPPHGSASVPNTGAPSRASAKRLPEHVAGGWCLHPSGRATCCSSLSMPSLCTRWQHPPISSGNLAQATATLIALGYSHCNGAINSWYHCIFKLCSVSPQPQSLTILFCHHILMVGADFALTAVQHSHFTFPLTVSN